MNDYAHDPRKELSLEASGWCWLALYLMLVAGGILGLVS